MLEFFTLRKFEVLGDLMSMIDTLNLHVVYCQQVRMYKSVDYANIDRTLKGMFFPGEYQSYTDSSQEYQLEALFEFLAETECISPTTSSFWIACVDSPIYADYALSMPGQASPYSVSGVGEIIGWRTSYGISPGITECLREAFEDIAERMEEGFEETHPEIAATIGRFKAVAESIGVHPASLPPGCGKASGEPPGSVILN